jgi:electron transfer flavoprotein alpha subunit
VIVAFAEWDERGVEEPSLQAVTFARRLAEQLALPLHALLVGAGADVHAHALSEFGVERAHVAGNDALDDYAPAAWAKAVVHLVQRLEPAAVVAAGSERGNEVLAHAAAELALPLAVNCTRVEPAEDYLVTRLRWGGSLLEEARLRGAVKLLTVAQAAVAAERTPAGGLAVEPFSPELSDDDLRVRVTSRIAPAAGKVSLADARVVVGGGRGVGSAAGFAALEELADLLGGAVGGSRVVTNLGWRPHADQVGQTGARIAPDVYIACGVSGAIQHMVGCKGAKRLLAINSDPHAPIVAKADYAVIGDLTEIVPAVSAEIRKVRAG